MGTCAPGPEYQLAQPLSAWIVQTRDHSTRAQDSQVIYKISATQSLGTCLSCWCFAVIIMVANKRCSRRWRRARCLQYRVVERASHRCTQGSESKDRMHRMQGDISVVVRSCCMICRPTATAGTNAHWYALWTNETLYYIANLESGVQLN